jgi:hypothetical protein
LLVCQWKRLYDVIECAPIGFKQGEEFDSSANTGDLDCHLACYGNCCNIDTLPKPPTLGGEPEPFGKLLVGGRVVRPP